MEISFHSTIKIQAIKINIMANFKIPVTWEVYSTITIEANTLEDAIREFDRTENEGEGYPLPTDPEYSDGSFRREDEEMCEIVNQVIWQNS